MKDSELGVVALGGTGLLFELNPKNGTVSECGYVRELTKDSPWKDVNPLIESSSFLTELGIMIFFIRALFFLFNLARLPRFLAELVSTFIVGASGIAQQAWFSRYLLPTANTQALETMASIGLTYYMFLVGLEMNLATLRKIEKKVICNVVAGILVPIVAGAGIYYLIFEWSEEKKSKEPLGALFLGVTLSVTSFPDLARIVSDLKILHTDVGRMALSSAFLHDLVTWIFLIVTMTIMNFDLGNRGSIPSTVIFLLTCFLVVRPVLSSIMPKTTEGNYTDTYIHYIFIGVLVSGFIADACGTHSMVGSFLFGLVMPTSEFVNKVSERLEETVTGILLPFFFITVGMRTDVAILPLRNFKLLAIVALACAVKVLITFLVSRFFGMSRLEGLTLGVLMNTKGISAIILLNLGVDTKALHLQVCVLMVVVYMGMTLMVKPIPYLIYSVANHKKEYVQRTIESITDCSEFRILLCIRGVHNIAGLTNLLSYSNSTKESPIIVFAANLVELVGRATAMMVVHGRKQSSMNNAPGSDNNIEQIIKALEEFELEAHLEPIETLTLVSPYDTMHEDIFNLAEDKRTSLILFPFNKSSNSQSTNLPTNEASSIRKVGQNLMKRTPCSVGLLLDRGMGLLKTTRRADNQQRQGLDVVMIFCGGPDSREALAYSYRMTKCPDVNLHIVRFVPGREAQDMMQAFPEFEEEQSIDDQFVNEFKFRTMCDRSIAFTEKIVNSGNEIVDGLRDLFEELHLYIVGKGEKVIAPFLRGLEWIECEELGPIGDALSTSRFAEGASILVVHKYKG
ncbi:hypothetical protein Tsubulata_035544 [Turnera subulata]|uniref:Cation/H+ exchanger domain-containing protein n=1 Tax=Turnera subulata TaxID=218843 RepID=A0A9Q0G8L0_9ROSI|nr:hypothetical protein Tsubulata_035544 [Turnera subulata]